jgi:hypothetical protein
MAKQAPAPNVATNRDYVSKMEWYAIYKDGSIITQFENGEQVRCTEDIDRHNLRAFVLTDRNGNVRFTHRFKPGQYFLYRARTAMRSTVGVVDRIHVVGWRSENQEQVAFIFESDGTVEIGEFARRDDPDFEDRPWFYPFTLNKLDMTQVS